MLGILMLNRFRFFRNDAVSRASSHQVLDDSAPLETPAPPTVSFSMMSVFFLKSSARMAAAYPEGPAPITMRSNFSIKIRYLVFYTYYLQHFTAISISTSTPFFLTLYINVTFVSYFFNTHSTQRYQ